METKLRQAAVLAEREEVRPAEAPLPEGRCVHLHERACYAPTSLGGHPLQLPLTLLSLPYPSGQSRRIPQASLAGSLHCTPQVGDTPLHAASENGHSPCVTAMLEAAAEIEVMNDQGNSALYAAAVTGRCLLAAHSARGVARRTPALQGAGWGAGWGA